ncbi:ABC transporter substrate-binding protein [Ilumatobacter sp.]|uniref:ABC transporter substrate-binding protein n=1 Tax=Ilumatobacter sp. TaxID=1967498 RepID=UPI003B5301E4
MRTSNDRSRRPLIAVLAGVALVVAACGSDDTSSPSATTGDDAVTTELGSAPGATATADTAPADTAVEASAPADTSAPGTASTDTTAPDASDGTATGVTTGSDGSADAVPERVVSLSPTHTEIMFAIGADDLLVAVDQNSNHPEEVSELPNELSGFEPNVEAIAAYEPDLVLIGGDFTGLGDQLADIGIDSWDGPAATSFDDTYAQITELGDRTGNDEEASELVDSMRARIDELASSAPDLGDGATYYHELGPELYTATSSTFIGEVYGLFGLSNVADELEADAGQYPQLNAEFLVEADPDLVYLADTRCCDVTAASFGEREGYGSIAAVSSDAVVELDDDIASRWGPRIVDFVEAVATSLERLPAG